VARIEEPLGDVAVATPAPKDELEDGDGAPAGDGSDAETPAIPLEPLGDALEQPATPVDVTGGAGLERTLEGHDTAVGEPPYTGPEKESGDAA